MTLEELEENHIEKDTIKYASKVQDRFYQDLIIRIGYVLHQNENKMGIVDVYRLKLAQVIVCELGLGQDLGFLKTIVQEYGGNNEI